MEPDLKATAYVSATRCKQNSKPTSSFALCTPSCRLCLCSQSLKECIVDYVRRAQDVLEIEIAGLQHVQQTMVESFDDVVKQLLTRIERGGNIVVTGVGKSLHIGQKIAATFTSTGTTSLVLHPAEAMHGDLGILKPKDVLLALSYSGETEELLSLVPIAKRIGVVIVAVTSSRDNALAQHSDAVLLAPVEREACPFNMAPTASTTAMLAIGDALAMVLLEARGFAMDDFAKLHPGGAIGRSMLLQVQDIMRQADRLAVVRCGTTVRDVVAAMTERSTGAATIVDQNGSLQGIFTDGDLRRHVFDGNDVAECKVDSVMTRDPITVKCDDLAVDALKLFEANPIDDLIVLNTDGQVVGIVDIQDLPKLKIL